MKDIGGNLHYLAFTFASAKVVKDFAPISQITPIVKSSTKPQENTIARFITWIVERCMQYYIKIQKKNSASGFSGVLFLLSVNRNPHCGMVCVGPPKFEGNKVVCN